MAAAILWMPPCSVVGKRELSQKKKLSLQWSVYILALIYGHEISVMTERTRSLLQAAEISFLPKVAGHLLSDRVRSLVIWERGDSPSHQEEVALKS